MKKILKTVFGVCLCAQLLSAQSRMNNPAASMWDDAEFVKSFTASYGFLSGFEPEISQPEKEALRGLIKVIKKDPRRAIADLEKQIKPGSSAAFNFILGNLYFQQGDLEEAEAAYREAVSKYRNFRRAHKNLGLVLVQNNKLGAAIPSISQALALGDVDGRSYGLLGYAYLTESLYYPAEAAYRQAILMQPKVRDWKLGLARCLVETGDYGEAIALFDTLVKQEPDNDDFWLLQANAFIGKDDTMAAARNIEVVRRMGKAKIPSLTMLGDIYMNNDRPELALSAYLEALEKSDDKNPRAIMRAASLLTQTTNFTEATSLIENLRAKAGDELREEDDLELLTLEAKIARAEGKQEIAFEKLSMIVERDSLNGEALIELGRYFEEQGDLERAINRFEQAEMIEDYERPALIAHAQALIRDKNYKEALTLLKRAQELREDRYLADYVERIEQAAR